MKISVVIPAYNEQDHIRSCLESLQNQEVKPYEIIIVDNNCTDDTVKIAKEYPTTVVKEKKQGMIQARNKGFEQGRGGIIARCDADVILPKDWVKKIKTNFKEHKIDALSGPVIFYDFYFLNKSSLFSDWFFKLMRLVLGHDILAGPNMALTKKIWNKVGQKVCLKNSMVHEDIDLSIHIAKYGKIGHDPSLKVLNSSRRIKESPFSFLVEYPWKLIKTILVHR